MGGGVTAKDFPQICQAVKENPIKARDFYQNKHFSASGEVTIIDNAPGIMHKYHVAIKSGNFYVHARTDDTFAVKNLAVGRMTNVSGLIDSVRTGYDGCSVSLRNVSF
jgi:hypothetical protein